MLILIAQVEASGPDIFPLYRARSQASRANLTATHANIVRVRLKSEPPYLISTLASIHLGIDDGLTAAYISAQQCHSFESEQSLCTGTSRHVVPTKTAGKWWALVNIIELLSW
jgi:hypothetical protein